MPDWGFVVFEARHAPGFFGELKDTYAKFHLAIASRALWESEGRKYKVATDMLFHIAPQVPHRQRDLPGQPVTLYAIHYRPELLRPEIARELFVPGMLPLDLYGTGVGRARQIRALDQEMEYAAKLLGSTERSVTAIAFECGFEELAHFHHSFKASYGTTPLAYRQKFRPNSQS